MSDHNHKCPLRLFQSPRVPRSEGPGGSSSPMRSELTRCRCRCRYELTRYLGPEVREPVALSVDGSQPCNLPPATKGKRRSPSSHTAEWGKFWISEKSKCIARFKRNAVQCFFKYIEQLQRIAKIKFAPSGVNEQISIHRLHKINLLKPF